MRILKPLALLFAVVGSLSLQSLQFEIVPSQVPTGTPPAFEQHPDATPSTRSESAQPDASPPVLAAMFVSWYGYDALTGQCPGGLGSTHWNDSPNTGGVIDVPVPGYYCSADPQVVSWQLGLLEDMGVRALFVSWWGWGDTNLDGQVEGHADAHMNKGIAALLDGIVARKSPIKVALIAEPFTLTQAGIQPKKLAPSQQQMVLDWLWDEYYGPESKYSDEMFKWEGSPLLLAFDPMELPSDHRYTLKQWTGRARSSQTEREGWDWFFAPPQDTIDMMSEDGVAFVYPRFDEQPAKKMGADYILWKPRSIDPNLNQGHYERQWQQLTDLWRENPSRLRMVVIYGWNHYGEQAHIEPSLGGQGHAGVGWEYSTKTKRYFEFLINGVDMMPPRPLNLPR